MHNTDQHRLSSDNRLALLMHGYLTHFAGKMGTGLLRYGLSPTVAVIDRERSGQNLAEVTGIPSSAPIVATVREAIALGADTLIPGVATPGGVLPAEWWEEVKEAVAAGMNLVNGLHAPLENHPDLPLQRPGQFIWDIRKEPAGLENHGNGMGRARDCTAKRVLFVGTDMANGKMTAALELDRAARQRGLKSKFLATGQIGIAISGDGIALDAVRIDFATGAVEQMVMKHGFDHDILFVEGQGSLLHPASSAAFALMRGSMPTHLILVHRANQEAILRAPWVKIPPLKEVAQLYEQVSSAANSLPKATVAGIALNTAHLPEDEARQAVQTESARTGLPTTDVIRFGAQVLLDAIITPEHLNT